VLLYEKFRKKLPDAGKTKYLINNNILYNIIYLYIIYYSYEQFCKPGKKGKK